MKICIIAMNSDVMFVQHNDTNNNWYQSKIPHKQFVSFMWEYFPNIMKKSIPYQFTDIYQIANWLYNYGTNKDGYCYMFDDNKKTTSFYSMNGIKVNEPKYVVNK